MSWIKRNLFFVISAAIALGLLAAAGMYDYKNWQRNKTALSTLNETYAALQRLNRERPSPGNDQINNIQAAREQERQLRAWIRRAGRYFQPIPPVPDSSNGAITDAQFAAARDHTLNQLQVEAANASVTLPPNYGFSFEAERTLVRFANGSLGPLAQQLGEVKAICEILYAAKVNSLDGIRRVRVSGDDASGPQSDYLDAKAVTNNQAVFMPYEVTFRGFSQDVANVLTSLAASPHGFIVKGINVQPAAAAAAAVAATATVTRTSSFVPIPGGFAQPPTSPPSAYAQPPAPTGRGGLPTVLNEQLLSVTMEIDIVKILPER
jgi:hypothetical protein